MNRLVVIGVFFLMLAVCMVSPTFAWNTTYTNCMNFTLNETSGRSVMNKPLEINFTSLIDKQADNDDFRIINTPCNLNGTEQPYQVIDSTSNSVRAVFQMNLTASLSANWSVIWNRSAATNPGYSPIITYRESFEQASLNISYWALADNDPAGGVNVSGAYGLYGSQSLAITISGAYYWDVKHTYSSEYGTFQVWHMNLTHAESSNSQQLYIDYASSAYTGVASKTATSATKYSWRDSFYSSSFSASGVSLVGSNQWAQMVTVANATGSWLYIQNVSQYNYTGGARAVTVVHNYVDGGAAVTEYFDEYRYYRNVYDDPSQTFVYSFGGTGEGGGGGESSPLQTISVSAFSPSNSSYVGNKTIYVQYLVSKINVTADKCWYKLDSGTNTTMTNCANTTINIPSLNGHTLIVAVNGTNLTGAEIRNQTTIGFTITNTDPSITSYSPSNTSYAYNSSVFNQFRVTHSGADTIDKCWYKLDSGSNVTSCVNTSISVSVGDHLLTSCANDTWGAVGCSTIGFTISPPLQELNVTVQVPSNVSYIGNKTINLNYFIKNINMTLDECWYKLNSGSNVTLSTCANTTVSILALNGQTLILAINGTMWNSTTEFRNETTIRFTIINIVPTVTIQGVGNATYIGNTTINDQFVVSHSGNDTTDQCWRKIDSGANVSGCTNNSAVTISAGFHTYTRCANDTWNGVGCSQVNFTIFAGLNVSVYNSTGSSMTNWAVWIYNSTSSYNTTGLNNPTMFYYDTIPRGVINITTDDGSSTLYYFNGTNTTTNNATNYAVINITLQPKGDNPITLSSSPSWSVSTTNYVTITCTAPEGSPELTKDGNSVANPYTALFGMGTYVFSCSVVETSSYRPTTVTNYLNAIPTGFGCTNSSTYAFRKIVSVNANITTFNFTTLYQNNSYVKNDLSDVYVGRPAWKNLTNGYYLIVNTTGLTNVTLYFGNYIANSTYTFNLTTAAVINITQPEEINPYYVFTFLEERTAVRQLPPEANTSMLLTCSLGNNYFSVNNVTRIIIPTFDDKLDEAKTIIEYSPLEQYSRNSIIRSIFEFKNTYLVDASQYQVVQMIISMQDNTGRFNNSVLKIKKQIENSLITITEHYFDAENKAIIYLINGDKYQIYVDNGVEERNIGNLYADSVDLTKTITIGEILIMNRTRGNLNYTLELNNATHTIIFNYYDPSNLTYLVEFWVYNHTNNALLYYANSSNHSIVNFNYMIPNITWTYRASVEIHHDFFGLNSITFTNIFTMATMRVAFPFIFPLAGTLPIPWAEFISVILIMAVPMAFGFSHKATAGIVVVLFAAIIALFNWIEISAAILTIALLFAILNKFVERRATE